MFWLAVRFVFIFATLGFIVGSEVNASEYERARWDAIHFKPAIDNAKDEQCLACHAEILSAKPREATPAGVKAANSKAWYQTLDTYVGGQEDFHVRHLQSPFAKEVMDLRCNTCHQGNDPREEAPQPEEKSPGFTLRKAVDVEKTCLMCHGQFPYELMTGLDSTWHIARKEIEVEDVKNGCVTCHTGKGAFRTVRHQVNFLKADAIEKLATEKSDTCFGCHGGRSWYRISYPYPRHPWPGMEKEIPEWAKGRPTESEARFLKKK